VSGTLVRNGQTVTVSGKLRGDQITLTAGNTTMAGRVNGDRIEGTNFSATRAAR
jgi:hypothetical protein